MAKKIVIQGLKNIASLEFSIPSPGAYLLTGSNGAGKTSLLTCLNRLGNRNAFQRGFRSSPHSALDSFVGASITYEIDNDQVSYRYSSERWVPSPRRNSNLLERCGFPAVAYIAADAARVQHQEQEFSPRAVRPVRDSIRDAMNSIFSTTKFSELCYLNLRQGGGDKAYLIRIPPRGSQSVSYYSERNFSLGELCALKLLLATDTIANGSLIIIDELELAIHPKAQSRIFDRLEEIARTRNLTIIFSTHSVSLIKSIDRRKLLFLENSGGVVTCISGCYPAYALGHITAGEERAPDCVVYVEDDSARKCFLAMLNLYRSRRAAGAALPTTLVVALGGFREILSFVDRAPQMLPQQTRVRAALDQDVQTEALASYQASNDHARLNLFARTAGSVKYLPWTPEVGLVMLIRGNLHEHERALKAAFADPRIAIPRNWGERANGAAGRPLRDACKSATYELVQLISQLQGSSEDAVRAALFDYLVVETERANPNSILSLVAGIMYN
jgi:energy-coupling factor transporter ATP-binding protein EcfA2